MNYKVLYRKYRPASFDELVGQDNIVKILKNSIINNTISHAYLFSGPRGTGKTSAAKIFARTINCENCINGVPCFKCSSCLMVDENPDIIEIDAASNNGVDEIREIRNNVRISPTACKYKIYIIDEVHMLSPGAFNALLKTLEEPPSNIVFILATTELHKVPITILSRCQKLEFKKVSVSETTKLLIEISKKENININDDVLKEIALVSDGGLRDALGLLDQLRNNNEEITINDFNKFLSTISFKSLEDFYEMFLQNDDKIIEFINNISNDGVDFNAFSIKLIGFLKDKAIINKNNYDLVKRIKNFIFELNGLVNSSKNIIDQYILLEMIVLNSIDSSLKEKEQKQEKIEEELQKTITIPIIKYDVSTNDEEEEVNDIPLDEDDMSKLINIRINNCFFGADKKYKNDYFDKWIEFIGKMKDVDIKIYSLVVDSLIQVASDKYLILSTRTDSQALLFNNKLKSIEKRFNDFVKTSYKLVCLSTNDWKVQKEKFISNKNKKYTFIDEDFKDSSINKSNLQKFACNIFDENKLEIK